MVIATSCLSSSALAQPRPEGTEMVLVAASAFSMGSEEGHIARMIEDCEKQRAPGEACEDWLKAELPRHRVTLDAFYIDRYEVTNMRFERFVTTTGYKTTAEVQGSGAVRRQEAGQWQWLQIPGASWRMPNGPGSSADPLHPVVQVSWHDAQAYCRWAGQRLPTEAEWEKAARGTDGRLYPWGSSWDPTRANSDKAVKTTTPVGSYPTGASPYDAHDMAGNVWEWVADWYDKEYYRTSPERNPPGPESGATRVLRGGSWHHSSIFLRSTYRIHIPPDQRGNLMGIRCARSAP